ncbi:MAG TPA: hypothetical protein VKY74_20265 [Chloroflexia bacterium]|nr:hypothetical protein [Chloroflexia bacterium]
MQQRQHLGLLVVAVTLILGAAGLAAQAPGTPAQANSPVWTQIAAGGLPGRDLNGVFMVDGPDGAWIAAGAGPSGQAVRLRHQGGLWTGELSPFFRAPLQAIVALADDNVWAVGDAGLIVHQDASGWHEVPQPVPDANLTTIQMLGNGDEGWAAGARPTDQLVLLHYHDGQWQQDLSLTGPGVIDSLHLVPGGGYAVGAGAGWRYTKTGWGSEAIPCVRIRFSCSTRLAGVRAISPDEAWAVGTSEGEILSSMQVLHRVQGQWQEVLPDQPLVDDTFGPIRQRAALHGVSFADGLHGLAVGWQHHDWASEDYPLIISYQPDGRWHYASIPYLPGVELRAVSYADAGHALAVGRNGVIFGYGYAGPAPAPWPTATPAPVYATPTPIPWPPTVRVPDPNLPGVLYFPAVGHSLQGGFRVYWEAHGGLAQFGYPITEEFTEPDQLRGVAFKVQYFERARFEWHPENRPPYDVLLGLLGRTVTTGREAEAPFQPAPAGAGSVYFPATQHNLAPEFVAYWQSHGGLPVYGYPISEAFRELSPTDGRPYLVQYFERNRLEYHPELPAPYRVSLGLLGTQVLQARGWLP